MLLCDKTIRALCAPTREVMGQVCHPMLEPYSEGVQGGGVISYGLSHAGYDLRLNKEILLFKNSYNEVVNPKRFADETYKSRVFDRIQAKQEVGSSDWIFVLPPHGYALGSSLEYIRMPMKLKGRCVGKSTLARSGILINTTPLEPGWHGHLTIEISNITPCPAVVFAFEGIAQLEFELIDEVPEKLYDEGKKYQGQTGVTPARVI